MGRSSQVIAPNEGVVAHRERAAGGRAPAPKVRVMRVRFPMLWAARNELNVSGFITYTDSETWAGKIHPSQALRQYRNEFVGNAKAVVVGMTSNGFTIADPNDRGRLDVVGFDTTAPAVIADFVRN
jgi:hypothetical protein